LNKITEKMALAITYRGPDDMGVWSDIENGIALGHRRLSILDLSAAGRQPMHSNSPCLIGMCLSQRGSRKCNANSMKAGRRERPTCS
jgi:hypothetical protein